MNFAMAITVILSFFTLRAFAGTSVDSSYELSCRAKAKEVAAETYRGCVTEYKASEIDRLRRNYQDKIKSMKSEYEHEIEKLGGKTRSGKKSAPAPQTVRRQEPQDDSQMDLPEPIPTEKADVE